MVTPDVAPDVTPVSDTFDKEQELYTQLDTLAANLSSDSLQFGWVAMALWNVKMEDMMEEAGGKEKKALGLFISHIQEREAKDIEKRKTVADRIRIGRYISQEAYEQISIGSGGYRPTYHQIRAVIFTKGGEMDEVKTSAMIDWCIANQWPTVADIRIFRGVLEPKAAVDHTERHFSLFVKMSQTIMAETDGASERHIVAKAVLDLWQRENNLSIAK